MKSLKIKIQRQAFIALFVFSSLTIYFLVNSKILATSEMFSNNNSPTKLNSFSFNAFSYGCFRDVGPGLGEQAILEYVKQDMTILAELNVTDIRTYGTGLNQVIIPQEAHKLGIKTATGTWASNYTTASYNEIDLALSVADKSSMLIIGNEALYSQQLNESTLITYLQYAKNHTNIPITTGEPWYTWLEHPTIAQVSDVILIHVYPFLEGAGLATAASYTLEKVQLLQAAFPSKEIIIGETGWPTQGRVDASEAAQLQYFSELLPLLQQHGIKCYSFEAFDEDWKNEGGSPDTNVGPHWGVFRTNRTAKKVVTEFFASFFASPIASSSQTTSFFSSNPHPTTPTSPHLTNIHLLELIIGMAIISYFSMSRRKKER